MKKTKDPRWPSDLRRYRWIVDGHNAIFAHPTLEAMQTGDRRAEARRRLEATIERFAASRQIRVMIVYDGNWMERNPDTRSGEWIRTVYSNGPEEEADDRILWIVQGWVREGHRVAVVTSDRATLGTRLPSGVLRIAPTELFRRIVRGPQGEENGRPAGDFSDIERHFLMVEMEQPDCGQEAPFVPAKEPERRVGFPVSPTRPSNRPHPPVAVPPPDPNRERGLEAKRARGRRAQERRLASRQSRKGGRQR